MTQAAKGTFLQLPSVFIETCDLPETAQIMYIRMLHSFGYKGIYTGSLRKLANLVRMSKSTVDRMLNVLSSSHLISRGNTEASETAQSILQISLDPEYLWNANIDYCTSHTVPNWDSIKEGEVSQDGTECPNLGRAVPPVGQAVPTRTLKRAPNITKTSKTSKDILVVSADAESDGGMAFLDKIVSFEEALEEVRNGNRYSMGNYRPDDNGHTVHHGTQFLSEQVPLDGKALLDPPSYRREEKEPEGLPRVVALLTPTTPEPTEKDTVSLSTDGRMMRTPIQMSTQPPTEEEPTQNTLIPAPPIPSLSTKGAAKTPSPNKTDESEKNKKRVTMKDCSPEEQARRRIWQAYFNTRRGGELLHGVGKRVDESNCIADLVHEFSDGQISLIDRFVLAEIFPYKLPVNRHKAGGRVIWDESQNAREVLKDRQKWPARDAPPGQALPQATPSQQEDVYTRKIRELAAESAARYTTPHMQGVAL